MEAATGPPPLAQLLARDGALPVSEAMHLPEDIGDDGNQFSSPDRGKRRKTSKRGPDGQLVSLFRKVGATELQSSSLLVVTQHGVGLSWPAGTSGAG